jgi:hypothetical protein
MENEKSLNKIEITIPNCDGGETKIIQTTPNVIMVTDVFKAAAIHLGFNVEFTPTKRKGSGG